MSDPSSRLATSAFRLRRAAAATVAAVAAASVVGTVACTAVGGSAARGDRAARAARDTSLADDVQIRRLAPDVWLHVTWHTLADGTRYPANGLLVRDGATSVLVDAGWTHDHADRLLRWASEVLGAPVRRAIVTHAHDDRTGGVPVLRGAAVEVLALALTGERASAAGELRPDSIPGLATGVQRVGPLRVFYPGPGHAPDNVVVYVPRARVLFGGCFLRADTATTLGNLADADVARWPASVRAVRRTFPDARVLVPGHGAVSGRSALDVTERLATAAAATARGLAR